MSSDLLVHMRCKPDEYRNVVGFRGIFKDNCACRADLILVFGIWHAHVTLAIDEAVLQTTKSKNEMESASRCFAPVGRL
jgi:hypothetical protein